MSKTVGSKLLLICSVLLAASTLCLAQTAARPEPISAPIPAYPPMAKAKRIHGVVLVDVQVNKEGTVVDAVAVMGGDYLRKAAVEAARARRS